MTLTRTGIAGTLLAFAVAAVCVRLGFWQLERRAERAAGNARLEARLAEEPVALAAPPRDTTGLLYRLVTVSGRWDAARSIILPGRALRGAPGVHVVTPLLLADDGAVLVNRGWLPSPDAASADLSGLDEPSPVSIAGLALPFPGAGFPAPESHAGTAHTDADSFRIVWYAPDEAALRGQFPYALGAVLVQALPGADAPAFPERIGPPPLDPGPHLSYAIQWFAFACIAIGGWFLLLLKGRGEKPGPGPAA